MGADSNDPRRTILRRRARFVAAALAGAGFGSASSSALAQGTPAEEPCPPGETCEKQMPTPPSDPCEVNPDECSARICLSDDTIEGELEPPSREELCEMDPSLCEPQVCLELDDCDPDHSDCEPHVCLSVDDPCASDPSDCEPHVCLSISSPTEDSSYRHDGFYLRLNAGIGELWTGVHPDVGSDSTVRGLSMNFDLGVGVTWVHRWVLGGGVLVSHAPSSEVRAEGATVRSGVAQTSVCAGPLLDFFPSPRRGYHVGVVFGPTVVAADGGQGVGFGGSLWLGYDIWVTEAWSIGGLVRGNLGYGAGGRDDVRQALFARSAALMLTGLWH